jgi:N-acetylglucosamine malate deacetylase 1
MTNLVNPKSVIAIGAHPDDIEFSMAGTLLLLSKAGFAIHYLTLANGSLGSRTHPAAQLRRIRRRESVAAARILGAVYHPSLTDDLEILYDLNLLRRVGAILRTVKPHVILTHSPQDYMEDHTTTCRLVTTAAFALGAPNFRTTPRRPAVYQDVVIYHSMPYGFCDVVRKRIKPEAYVDVSTVHDVKLQALQQHRSQQTWLSDSQGLNSYLQTMDDMDLQLGRWSRRFHRAEGWRRHLHYGFSQTDIDPLPEILGNKCWVDPRYLQQE